MSRVLPKSKVKPTPKRKPKFRDQYDSKVAAPTLTEEQLDRLLKSHLRGSPPPLSPELTPKQRLLLAGVTMQALVGLIAEYPRRHTIDFEGIVKARFMDGVREIQHKEREAGLKGGLAELSEADCRMTLGVPQ